MSARWWSQAACLAIFACACSPAPADSGVSRPEPFADRVVSFEPGDCSGFGQDSLPDVVLGPPQGAGERAGSLDVVSLGDGGVIVLALDDLGLVDGEGPDLLVFENAFVGWPEPGFVAASADGERWAEWPCDPEDAEGGFPGCAGVHPVYADGEDGADPTDPATAGGDAFDLADLGLEQAWFVRVRDSGHNLCAADTGGFDLDAIAVVNGVER
ncbi:MAG: cell surface protein [Pseudomonadota bacterium]